MSFSPPSDTIRSIFVRSLGDGQRVDVYLTHRFPKFSRSQIKRMIRDGEIGRPTGPIKPATTLFAGEELWVNAPELAPPGPPPPLPKVIHEDDRLLVVSKPAGMLAHPAGLTFTYGLVGIARAARPDHVVDLAHRLDRETSGINVLTKDKPANAFLKRAFFEKRPKKTYHAIVHGSPEWEVRTIDGAIGHAAGSAIRIRRGIAEDGLGAKTEVAVLKRMGRLSLVSAKPQTGRTHQIRVHLESVGLPILGDKMYGQPDEVFLHHLDHGDGPLVRNATRFTRHALHAAEIAIPHPDGGTLSLEAPLEEDMAAIVAGAGPAWPSPEE